MLSTKPAPTGSVTLLNTIGKVRVACSNGTITIAGGQDDVGRERDQLASVSAGSRHRRRPSDIHPHVAALCPAQSLQRLQKPTNS